MENEIKGEPPFSQGNARSSTETSDRTRYNNLMATDEKAILSNRAAADHPQPVDYGLTYDAIGRNGLHCPSSLNYKKSNGLKFFLAIWVLVYSSVFIAVFAIFDPPHSRGDWTAVIFAFPLGMISSGLGAALYVYPILHAVAMTCIASYERRHPSPGLVAYREALRLHELYVAAAREAEEAARKAEQELQRRKRSYWEGLSGYQFETATAEVLKRHQFNPRVTGGSADGGVDIEVTRAGREGVVQCKAHVACVGPHTVRDLFGVMHHSSSEFGIIVSRGGFTKGAIDFARNKPIFLVDTCDLIAMQEGQDVLGGEFLTT